MLHKVLSFLFLLYLWSCTHSAATREAENAHTLVAMRLIGHHLLLSSGDSTSRIFPVEKTGDSYKIRFESEFQFTPEKLSKLVDSLMQKTQLASGYVVEVKDCKLEKVIYSFEITRNAKEDLVPCIDRIQPRACYTLLITLVDPFDSTPRVSVLWLFSLLMAGGLGGGLFYFSRHRKVPARASHLISLGKFIFDPRTMRLYENGKITELTGKESELLLLLYSRANLTVERDEILNVVWEGSGDYIGRTPDVFISKLRKKLESDPSLEILNVRGVGYKLVIEA